MAWYKSGSVNVTNGNATVYGNGTLWVDVSILYAGDVWVGPDGRLYEIASIQSNTQLTLVSAYLGATANTQSYAIMPIGLLPSALAQQVKTTLSTANTALSQTVRFDANQNLTSGQKATARSNIGATAAADVGLGLLSKSVAGGVDITLSTDEAANLFYEFTGALTANINVVVPGNVRQFFVRNNTTGAYTLTVKTLNGTGAKVLQGTRIHLECDGTNVLAPTSEGGAVTVDASSNVGIGTTSPSAKLQVGTLGSTGALKADTVALGSYSTSPQYRYIMNHGGSGLLGIGSDGTGSMIFGRCSDYSGTQQNEFGRFDPAGNLLIGTTSVVNSSKFVVSGGVTVIGAQYNAMPGTGTQHEFVNRNGAGFDFYVNNAGALAARLDNGGNLLVGVTSGTTHQFVKSVSEGTDCMYIGGNVTYPTIGVKGVASIAWSTTTAGMYVGRNTTSNRSINAAGTINASGADYAEYMTKADDCGAITRGQIIGVNADGKLTDKWADSVSFVIKSTNPSYVGGDVWGTEEALGMQRPVEPVFVAPAYTGSEKPDDLADGEASWGERDAALAQYEADRAAYADAVQASRNHFDTVAMPAYQAALTQYEGKLEAERQKVDRIAFCGQVPVNVQGAKPGQYVVPVQDGDGIGGVLVDDADITFERYRRAVGRVLNVLPDGRPNVVVKVV